MGMRPQLLSAGVLVIGLGVLFYVLGSLFPQSYVDTTTGQPVTVSAVPFLLTAPLVIGGLLMVLAAPFLKPSELPVKPPEGYKFCVYCSETIPVGAERCTRCNGIQPKVG